MISNSRTLNIVDIHQPRAAPITTDWMASTGESALAVDTSAPGSRIVELIGDFAETRRWRKAGEYLFRAGGIFEFFYVLNAGFAKSSYISEDGRERITGVHLRGDILGLDAIATGTHGCDAVTLDACEVIAISYEHLLTHCQRNPALVHELHRAFSAEIRSDRDLMLSMTNASAEGRVASFLLEMSLRFASRGFSATQLQLHLTRQEIGSMLGLKLETVSRVFSRLAKMGLITVCLRDIVLLDLEGLLDISTPPGGTERSTASGNRRNFGESPATCNATRMN